MHLREREVPQIPSPILIRYMRHCSEGINNTKTTLTTLFISILFNSHLSLMKNHKLRLKRKQDPLKIKALNQTLLKSKKEILHNLNPHLPQRNGIEIMIT